jgi:tetratricopeptide (TPR) repeat protein
MKQPGFVFKSMLFVFLVNLFFALAGCDHNRTVSPQSFRVPKDPPGAEYVIEAEISVEGQTASVLGKGTISLENSASIPLSRLAVDWVISPTQTLEVGLRGRALRIVDEDTKVQPSTPIFFDLPEPLQPDRKVRLNIRFSLTAAVRDGQIFLSSWHPRLWWEGIPVRDSFKIKLNLPEGFAVAASGRLNPDSGYFENDCVTSRFGLYLSNTMKTEQRESEGVLITALFTDKGRECALYCLNAAADIISFYKKWLGIYPHRSLCIIPGGPRPMGGYPYASGIVVIHGQETFDPGQSEARLNWWKWITAHEIGHQYWGEYVMPGDASESYTDSWLMIGLGICADKEYMLARGLGWAQHQGFINSYLQGVRAKNDTTMDAPPSLRRTQRFDINNVIIHGKSFALLSALETLLGKETFDRIYRRTLDDRGGKRLGWREFRRIAEEGTDENLVWFFEDWVRSNKILECRIVSQNSTPADGGHSYEVRVEYGLDSIRQPVPVKATFEDGTAETQWTNRFARFNILRFRSAAALKEIQLDPEGRLAVIKEQLPRTTEELAEVISNLDWSGTGEAALEIFNRPETAGIESASIWFKMGLLLYDGGHYSESFEAFEKSGELDPADFNLFATLTWRGHLKDLQGEREKAVEFYRAALKHDTGRTMQHDQYRLRIGRSWVEERLKTPFRRD